MMNNNYLPNQINVTVNGQSFWIPTAKYTELLRLLSAWNSIQANQPQVLPQENSNWTGQQIINE